MLLQLIRVCGVSRHPSPLVILVAASLLESCGETGSNNGDEDRLSQDGGPPGELEAAGPEAKPARPATPGPAPAAPTALPQSGRPAPDLALPDVETGETWSLAGNLDPTGQSCPKGFLVAFMASWCTYCTQSLPTLVELEKANPDLAVVTVTVDVTPEAQKAELEKVRKAGLSGPVLVADAATAKVWAGSQKGVPKYYFIDHNGKITSKDDGFGEKVGPMMPKQAARALAD